jgi:hypothetical protein
VLTLFSPPDPYWLRESYNTYRTCTIGADEDIVAVDARDITSVIAMVPDTAQGPNMYCAVYKPGRVATRLAGVQEQEGEE